MSQQNMFYKRTKRGKILKLVKEKYLRDDMSAGYHLGKCISQVSKCFDNYHTKEEL